MSQVSAPPPSTRAESDDRILPGCGAPLPSPRTFCDLLLGWYDTHARELPWRGPEVTPYQTLVSEVMLQQTRVDTVLPRFSAFLERFPTVDALAAAELDDVLGLWSGLGYYSRARNLHAAAGQIVERGAFPTDLAGLRALKGVGPYIAGAVGSIALGLPVPAVDGNLERVLARVVRSDGGRTAMTKVASALIEGQPERAGDVNQALMDVGATICGPRSPTCGRCPLQPVCGAAETEDPTLWPVRRSRKKAPEREAVAGVRVDAEGRLLVARRPPEGLFGGLLELPGALLPATRRVPGDAPALAAAWRTRVGGEPEVGEALGSVSHVLTHMRLTLRLFTVRGEVGAAPRAFYDRLDWVSPAALDQRGVSTLTRKALAVLGAGPQQDLFRGRSRR